MWRSLVLSSHLVVQSAGIAWKPIEVDMGYLLTGKFFVLGDWGCGNSDAGCTDSGVGQRAVAKTMDEHAAEMPVDFVLNVGDAFYPTGVADEHDPQWEGTFEQVYAAEGLQVPWYGVLGNHDWIRNASAVATSRGRWRIPSLSYAVTGQVHMGPPVTFLMIDTNFMMTADICHRRSGTERGPLSPEDYVACRLEISDVFEQQVHWFKKRLASIPEGHLKVVVGHHPVYSTGKWAVWGADAGRTLDQLIMPLMQNHGVDFYISGHDHIFQHLNAGNTDFFIVGAGGGDFEDHAREHATSATIRNITASVFGHGLVEVGTNNACLSFFGSNTKITEPLYRYCRPLEKTLFTNRFSHLKHTI